MPGSAPEQANMARLWDDQLRRPPFHSCPNHACVEERGNAALRLHPTGLMQTSSAEAGRYARTHDTMRRHYATSAWREAREAKIDGSLAGAGIGQGERHLRLPICCILAVRAVSERD